MINKLIIRALCSTAILMSCTMAPAQTGTKATTQTADQTASAKKWAVVNVSDQAVRAEPRYPSECVTQTRMGTLVEVLGRSGYWVKIRTPEPYEGWVNEMSLAPHQKKTQSYGVTLAAMNQAAADAYVKAPKYIVKAERTKVYTKADQNSEVVSTLLMSNMVKKGSAALENGFVSIVLPDGRTGWVFKWTVSDFAEWASSEAAQPDAAKIADIIALAKTFVGCPYLWGGMSVGHFDCSGLVGFCYFMNGVLLPRDASQQVNCGVEVAFKDMQAGDLVFFGNKSIAHVGLCIGDHRIIHSSQLVRINSLIKGEADYYGRNILHIRRIFGHMDKGGNGFKARLISGEYPYFEHK